MATIIETTDARSIRSDCAYLGERCGFQNQRVFICNCPYLVKPKSCTGCAEATTVKVALKEQMEWIEEEAVQYQLACKVRDLAEGERIKVSERIVQFLLSVPRDTDGKIRLNTPHHLISLVEAVSSRTWIIDKTKEFFSKLGANVVKSKMTVTIELPSTDPEYIEKMQAAIGRALKRADPELKVVTQTVTEAVSEEAINGAIELGIATTSDLHDLYKEKINKPYPKITDRKEAIPKETFI